jgi:predicted RNA-binding protein
MMMTMISREEREEREARRIAGKIAGLQPMGSSPRNFSTRRFRGW